MLREELDELNSAILIYQTAGNATTRIPLLPIPLKESVKAKYDKVVKVTGPDGWGGPSRWPRLGHAVLHASILFLPLTEG
eukprot:m.280494 g.280494  ORF g.280494 m.280494 type:complete len:80 (+) comp40634_c0_seq75:336-575(+)